MKIKKGMFTVSVIYLHNKKNLDNDK
jgi:hypothetical protein